MAGLKHNAWSRFQAWPGGQVFSSNWDIVRCLPCHKQFMVAGEVVRPVSCKQKCSRRQRRQQTRRRHRRRSRTRSAAAAAARSSVTPPRPASGRPTPHPGGPRSSDWGTEGRPGGRTSATPLDQTPHSLRGRQREQNQRELIFSRWSRNSTQTLTANQCHGHAK